MTATASASHGHASGHAPTAPIARLAHLPLPLFAVTMGLAGLGLAWREAHHALGAPSAIGEAILALATAIYVATLLFHGLRAARHPEMLSADLKHPVRLMFAGAITIGLMLISGAALPHDADVALVLWSVAVAVHLLIGVLILRKLLVSPGDPVVLTPPLLIPLVGNVLAPVFGAKLGIMTLSWALFGVGMLLWLAVQPLLFYRLFAGPELPPRLKPTLVILLAPPSIGVVALVALTGGQVGPMHIALWGFAAILAAVFLAMIRTFIRMPFAMSWWGWAFPSAAFVIASELVLHRLPTPMPGVEIALWTMLAIATVVIAITAWRTFLALVSGELLKPEH